MKKFLFVIFLCVFYLAVSVTFSSVHAQTTSCLLTKVGNPKGKIPTPPEGCEAEAPTAGIIYPPNLKNCISVPPQHTSGKTKGTPGEYCEMPAATDGSYTGPWRKWGSKEIIGVLYTVAQRWKQRYPNGNLIINDISAPLCPYASSDPRCGGYHTSHAFGVSVDVLATTNKKDCVASMPDNGRCPYKKKNGARYNATATTELAKLFIDTGYADLFLFNSDLQYTYVDTGLVTTTVGREVFIYAKSRYPKFTTATRIIQDYDNHSDHFHLYINRDQDNYDKQISFSLTYERSKLKNCGTLTGAGAKVC